MSAAVDAGRGEPCVSRPPGPVAPLQLRPSDSGGSAALLVADVSGVRADVGA